jgi:hypothetical protein
MTQEALKLALEALEACQPVNYCMNNNGERFPMMQEDPFRFERNTKAIAAIKEALLAQKREPIAMLFGSLPVYDYTTPPQRTWVGLTLDEIALLHANYPNPQGFALALQAKLKEKNNA